MRWTSDKRLYAWDIQTDGRTDRHTDTQQQQQQPSLETYVDTSLFMLRLLPRALSISHIPTARSVAAR